MTIIKTTAQVIEEKHKGVDVRIAARRLSKEYRFNWDKGEEEYTFPDQSKIIFCHLDDNRRHVNRLTNVKVHFIM